MKVASIREVVLGAPLRVILKHLASRTVAPDMNPLVALVHRPTESFFLVPQVEIQLPANLFFIAAWIVTFLVIFSCFNQ